MHYYTVEIVIILNIIFLASPANSKETKLQRCLCGISPGNGNPLKENERSQDILKKQAKQNYNKNKNRFEYEGVDFILNHSLRDYEDRIVNGYEVNHLPWQASLATKSNNFIMCGGSLINPRYVVSAAHCFCGGPGEGDYCTNNVVDHNYDHKFKSAINNLFQYYNYCFSVILGLRNSDKPDEGKIYGIVSVRVPEERIGLYTRRKYMGPWDIALIKLDRQVVFIENLIAPVCINSQVQDQRVYALVSGFGSEGSGDGMKKKIKCWTDEIGPKMFSE